MIENLLKGLGGKYTRIQCEKTEENIVFVYTLVQYAINSLIIHGCLNTTLSLRLLEKSKDKAKIIVEEKSSLHRIIGNLNSFNTFILIGYEFNDFENEFLRQMCRANKKTVLLFSEALGQCSLRYSRGCYTFLGKDLVMEDYALKIRNK